MNIGIVSEGPTDFLVLERIIMRTLPEAAIIQIHPIRAVLEEVGTGWKGVRRWCERYSQSPTEIISVDRKLDLLIIHVDCDIARELGISMDCPPAQPTAAQLREYVLSTWLISAPSEPHIIIASPSRATDAWLLIGMDEKYWPRGAPPVEIECDDAIDGELIRRHLARNYRGRAKKFPERYAAHLDLISNKLAVILFCCAEAQIFLQSLNRWTKRYAGE